MEKLLLFCLFGVTTLYSQEIKSVKDAVYIIFEASKNQLKEEPYLINRNLEPEIMYKINFDKEGKSFFAFYKAKYLDFDAIKANKITDVKVVDRSFLKKNKENTLNMKDFLRLGIEKSHAKIVNSKKIYLIDKKEIKKGKVTMYQVGLFSTYFPEI